MRFKVGDEVTISPESGYYGDSERNPKDVKGMIYKIKSSAHAYQVIWINSERTNQYREKDLCFFKVEDALDALTPSIPLIKSKLNDLEFGDIFVDPMDKDLNIYMGNDRPAAVECRDEHSKDQHWYLPLQTSPVFLGKKEVHCYADHGSTDVYKLDMNIKEVLVSLLDKDIIDLSTIEE